MSCVAELAGVGVWGIHSQLGEFAREGGQRGGFFALQAALLESDSFSPPEWAK